MHAMERAFELDKEILFNNANGEVEERYTSNYARYNMERAQDIWKKERGIVLCSPASRRALYRVYNSVYPLLPFFYI